MCGIAAIIDLAKNPIDADLLVGMARAIAHRGPDDEGYVLIDEIHSQYATYSGPSSPPDIQSKLRSVAARDTACAVSVALGHRRFAILDLSHNGHQPFFDRERRCCVAFNGEIYNYIELREELTRHGYTFSTSSDTEVLLAAYQVWGVDCFARLNGFWAIALYDFRDKRLIVSRDRIGKKPLYWAKAGNRVFLASEIKALLTVPEIHRRRQVNEDVLYTWLTCGQKDFDSNSCFADIHSLPAACWAVVNENFPNTVQRFWRAPEKRLSESDISITEAVRTVKELLRDSVRIRLRADVPLSIELSGGLDSSTLVALAAESQGRCISTYTVRFTDKNCNEELFARLVAQRYRTDYCLLDAPIGNFWSQILPFTYLEEEPYHSPNLHTNQVIWAAMRSTGTKVSLNGAGGDEDFAGYSGYYIPAQIENLQTGRIRAYAVNALRYSQGRTNLFGIIRPLAALARVAVTHAVPGSAPRQGHGFEYFKGRFTGAESRLQTLSEALYSDMTTTLMPYWLRSGDRGYMGVPFEVRAPFLDYRVVEFCLQLPVTYLFRDGWHKWILRKAVEDLLPASVVWRRQKMGFPFPFDRFYADHRGILDLIVRESRNPYVTAAEASRMRHDWKIISFLLWYELFFAGNTQLFHKIEAIARRHTAAGDYGFASQFLLSGGLVR